MKKKKPNRILEAEKAISEKDIAKVESLIGIKLPEDLKAHYLKHNGGRPKRAYLMSPEGTEMSVHFFLPMLHLGEDGDLTFEENYLTLVKKKKLIPDSLIPFATDEGGDYYAMDRKSGKIFFYAMDHAKTPEKAKDLAAKSLEDFLLNMVEEEDLYGEEEE